MSSLVSPEVAAYRASFMILSREYARLQNDMVEGFLVKLVEHNFFLWEIGIFGPPDTPFAGGFFRAHLKFPRNYPFSPPSMRFLTKLSHPNIHKDGKVCVSLLELNDIEYPNECWTPIHSVRTILLSIALLLCEPNIESVANASAAFWYNRWLMSNGKETKYEDVLHQEVCESAAEARRLGIKIPLTREEYCVIHQPDSGPITDDEDEDDFEE